MSEVSAVAEVVVKKPKHLMVDIETLGTQTNSIVLSIAAVTFNMDGTIGDEFEIFPSIENQLITRKVDWGSIKFWFSQPDGIRNQQKDAERINDLKKSLYLLKEFCENSLDKNFKIWGNGFDIPLLNQAYNEFNMNTPWSYKNIFDCRTVVWLSKISTSKYSDENDMIHSAISDCKYQIRFIVDAIRVIKS